MIVYMNVCDHCGSQNRIMSGSGDGGIDVLFTIESAYESIKNPSKYKQKDMQGTFCDKNCFISWLKENLDGGGFVIKEDDD